MIRAYHANSRNTKAIVTIAIGDKYLSNWERNICNNWISYCKKFGINLFVVSEHLISESDINWKKPTWQKLLLGKAIKECYPSISDVCYLDTDFIINPLAPNVFDWYVDKTSIGIVSQVKNLPYDLNLIKRIVSFGRNRIYSSSYPLDSAIFMEPKDIFRYHNMPEFDDYACAGFFLFNVEEHADLMSEWFYSVDNASDTLTGGDEPHFNYFVQNWGNLTWLPYKFQALWLFEMAANYSFLYSADHFDKKELIADCILSSLTNNYFLHFAGSWNESNMIDHYNRTLDSFIFFSEDFIEYLKRPVSGKPKGIIRPMS